MGCFDTIHYQGEEFQTKQLDCELRHFHIEGGRMIEHIYGDHSDEENPKPIGFRDIDHNGDIYFGKYLAVFHYGQLMAIIEGEQNHHLIQ